MLTAFPLWRLPSEGGDERSPLKAISELFGPSQDPANLIYSILITYATSLDGLLLHVNAIGKVVASLFFGGVQ